MLNEAISFGSLLIIYTDNDEFSLGWTMSSSPGIS